MSQVEIQVAREFPGTAEVAYGILADYHEGHPSILPARYFTHLTVERGGHGAGTVIRFGLKLAGRVQEARATVSEPEPGRVLVERVEDSRGTETRFTVEPLPDRRVRVTIRTVWTARGLSGTFERWFAPRLLRPIYREELENLERVVRQRLNTPWRR